MKLRFSKLVSPTKIVTLLILSTLTLNTPIYSADNSSTLFEKATTAIAAKQYDQAEALYQQAIDLDTDSALAALGRFYKLTNQQEKISSFKQELLNTETGWSDFARSRGLTSIGEIERAAEILSESQEVKEQNQQAVLLLARLYTRLDEETKAHQVVLTAIEKTHNPDDKELFALSLIRSPKSDLWFSPEQASIALDAYINNTDHSRVEIIEHLDQHIITLQTREDYFKLREKYLSLGKEKSAGSAWFASRMLVREQKADTALEYLAPLEKKFFNKKGWTLLAQEKVDLLMAVGDKNQAKSLTQTVNAQSKKDLSPEFIIKEAEIATASKDNETAISLVNQLDPDNLNESNRQSYYILLLTLYSREGDLEKIIEIYPKAVHHSRRDSIKNFHRIIFSNILATEQHKQLRDLSREKAGSEPGESDVLWLLSAEACKEARQQPNELEALYQYAKACPDDLYGIKTLAEKATPLAVELRQAPAEMLAAPDGEPERVALLAEESLKRWIELTPYDPKPIIVLMNLYKVLEREDEAPKLAQEILRKSGSVRVAQNIAYVMARNGYPEEALKIYDALIKENPEETQVKMNRAACLTRVDRTDEAKEFYQNLLINGDKGKEFHAHELIDRLWVIAEAEGSKDDLLAWFDELPEKQEEELRNIGLSDVAALYAREKMPERTEKNLRKLLEYCDETQTRHDAWHKMAMTWNESEEYEKAISIFKEGETDLAGHPEIIAEFMQARAEILHLAGKPQEAIELFKQVYFAFESDRYAWLGLFRAAEICEEINETQQARDLYEQFLKTPSTDFPRRHAAKQKVELFSQLTAQGNTTDYNANQ